MDDCPVKYALSVLNGKWKLPIVWELGQQDVIRFNELQRKLPGISSFMLAKSLEELEGDSVVIRKQYNEIPPRVEYSLTELGKQIRPSLEMLATWGIEARKQKKG
ncbi:winged helix-turn-helix transcriptional regulator [Alkaliphilus crotonatoxidans]